MLNQTGETAELLRAMRANVDLSRDALAARSGVTSRTIAAIEREGVQPKRATLIALADGLGCELRDLGVNDG